MMYRRLNGEPWQANLEAGMGQNQTKSNPSFRIIARQWGSTRLSRPSPTHSAVSWVQKAHILGHKASL